MKRVSPVGRFVAVSRDFGFGVATRVVYSKLRGLLFPALALPDAPAYPPNRREVSVLLGTDEHGAATLDRIEDEMGGRGGFDGEVCLCERVPVAPAVAVTLARYRGTQPWLRIVTADRSVDAATAAKWTVEQATGQWVVLVAPGYVPERGAIAGLLTRLRNDPDIDAVALTETGHDCRLLLTRKSTYLTTLPACARISAPAVANALVAAGVPILSVTVGDGITPD